jgi:hypothetical protein
VVSELRFDVGSTSAGWLTHPGAQAPALSIEAARQVPATVGWRSRSERQPEAIVERIVEWAAPVGNFLVLMKTNYYDWAALMRVML